LLLLRATSISKAFRCPLMRATSAAVCPSSSRTGSSPGEGGREGGERGREGGKEGQSVPERRGGRLSGGERRGDKTDRGNKEEAKRGRGGERAGRREGQGVPPRPAASSIRSMAMSPFLAALCSKQ